MFLFFSLKSHTAFLRSKSSIPICQLSTTQKDTEHHVFKWALLLLFKTIIDVDKIDIQNSFCMSISNCTQVHTLYRQIYCVKTEKDNEK